jgi:hypothetical protein
MKTTPDLDSLMQMSNGVFNPLHEVTDHGKADRIAADMAERGWQGAPLVVDCDGGNAYTGSHRIAAVVFLNNDLGIHVDIPYIEIAELAEAHGVNWAELVEEWGGNTYDAAIELREKLPASVVERLGYDVGGE